MKKSAPSLPRILTMVVFALSCFGLLLFLWLSFGGPIPLKPQGYRVQVAFPEATTLATEADVRVAGVSVGKVRKLEVDGDRNRTVATIELDREFAPLRTDARGDPAPEDAAGRDLRGAHARARAEQTLPEGGRLADAQVGRTVELDEIFDSLDPPTRAAFRAWQQELAKGIEGRGRDFNDALGTLPGFAADGADVLRGARLAGGRAAAAGQEHRRHVRGADRERAAAADADHRRPSACSTRRRRATTRSPRRSGSSRRSSTSRRRRSRGWRRSRPTREPLVQDLRPVARDLQADAAPTCARWRPTSSASSATSTR